MSPATAPTRNSSSHRPDGPPRGGAGSGRRAADPTAAARQESHATLAVGSPALAGPGTSRGHSLDTLCRRWVGAGKNIFPDRGRRTGTRSRPPCRLGSRVPTDPTGPSRGTRAGRGAHSGYGLCPCGAPRAGLRFVCGLGHARGARRALVARAHQKYLRTRVVPRGRKALSGYLGHAEVPVRGPIWALRRPVSGVSSNIPWRGRTDGARRSAGSNTDQSVRRCGSRKAPQRPEPKGLRPVGRP